MLLNHSLLSPPFVDVFIFLAVGGPAVGNASKNRYIYNTAYCAGFLLNIFNSPRPHGDDHLRLRPISTAGEVVQVQGVHLRVASEAGMELACAELISYSPTRSIYIYIYISSKIIPGYTPRNCPQLRSSS